MPVCAGAAGPLTLMTWLAPALVGCTWMTMSSAVALPCAILNW